MSGSAAPGAPDELLRWIRFLHEIGVEDLAIPSEPAPVKRTRAPVASQARPAVAPAPAGATSLPPATPGDRSPRPGSPATSDTADPAQDPARALDQIRQDLGPCTRCKLHSGRTQIVFGVGNPCARLMFVGEGPGEQEDLRGEPFVGRAGEKLDEMIRAIGLRRQDVYIANIVKCRPPKNRDPEPDEIETCSPFLVRQIRTIAPQVIVTLGGPASKTLLQTRVGITRLRGQWHTFQGIPVMPTFHPAYVLRNYTVATRTQVWEDLKAARARIDV